MSFSGKVWPAMTMLKVANCPSCGQVFQKNLRNLCQGCQRAVDADFTACSDYLRKAHKATTSELSEATGVSLRQIHAFIKENKLPATFYPGLTYPCSSCGAGVRKGHLCTSCSVRLTAEIRQMRDKEEKAKERGAGFQIRDRLSY
ncbi:flagellar operon protein TIGR03826 [Paenibacillus sp. UNCCL117]|nr:flagellar operon protein TIGR03826 [Paenibacillus sp. cl123]SFW14511.1 flagellar operon protein TIGR03826 [Paenibacillus sp. UNCCL117]